MTLDLDKIALEVEDEISTSDPELLFTDTEAFCKEFARRLVERIQREQKPFAWVRYEAIDNEYACNVYYESEQEGSAPLFRFPPATPSAVPDGCGPNCIAGSHTLESLDEMTLDAACFRWLTEDFRDPETRRQRAALCERLPVMSHSAARRDIAAAMEDELVRDSAAPAPAGEKKGEQ